MGPIDCTRSAKNSATLVNEAKLQQLGGDIVELKPREIVADHPMEVQT